VSDVNNQQQNNINVDISATNSRDNNVNVEK